jgi:hypothetical protein
MPAPVDYVSWTPRIAGFATDPRLLGCRIECCGFVSTIVSALL